MSDQINLGPWRGINNREDETASVYAPGGEVLPFVRDAVNVDSDRMGWLRRRVGQTKLLALTNGHSGVSIGGMFLLVDNGSLIRVYPNSTDSNQTLTSGLEDNTFSYCEAGGSVYYCNGADRGRIEAGVHGFWGLTPPNPPILASTTGSLPAGRYFVALTVEDGIESGARRASTITLDAAGGISVAIDGVDTNASYVNIYVSMTNGKEVFWADRIDSSETSYVVASLPQSSDPFLGYGMLAPPDGAYICRWYRGRLLVCAGNALYWSQPLAYHLFRLATDVQLFAERPVMLEPSVDGFYLAEGTRTWWVGGDDPENWSPIQVDDRRVSEGSAVRVPGRKIPALQATSMVPVWATENGPVAGLPSGRLVHLTEANIAMEADAKVTGLYREEEGLTQILLNLRQRGAPTRFAASDRVTATVIKAYLPDGGAST